MKHLTALLSLAAFAAATTAPAQALTAQAAQAGHDHAGHGQAATVKVPATASATAQPKASAGMAPLTLTLSLNDGDKAFSFARPIMVGSQPLTVSDIRMYVSNVALIRPDGSEVPVEGLNLATLKKGGSAKNVPIFKGQAPQGTYKGVRFDVGVPRDLNHQDAATAAAPLSVEQGMYWAWNSGYIFFSLHGDVKGTKVANHMGGDNHRFTVSQADLQKPGTELEVTAAGLSVPFNLDLQKLYSKGLDGEAWDFSKANYQQVHMGAVANQYAQNVMGAFSAAAPR